jgi:hypothetical protein
MKSKIVSDLWDSEVVEGMKCPDCGGDLLLGKTEPIEDWDTPYHPYETKIHCSICTFETETKSFTLSGCVKDFDMKNITIGGWSDTGSRVVSEFEHTIDFKHLKELRDNDKIVEFLVVDNHIVKILR